MSFPYHDRAWLEAVGVLLTHLRDEDSVLAPDRFWWALPTPVQRWVRPNFTPERHFDWVVAHKGELAWVPRRFVQRLRREMAPVFANEVFVILGPADRALPLVTADENHLRAFDLTVDGLSEDPIPPNPYDHDSAIGAATSVGRFGAVGTDEMRGMQEDFFDAGGYEYPTRRDRAYYEDIHDLVAEMHGRWAGRLVVDIACAASPAGPVDPDTRLVRLDLAVSGVAAAVVADAGHDNVTHTVADAHRLPFPDDTVDAVLFVDAIEHVRDAATVIREIGRTLRPGGEAFITYANADSMHQVLTRRLGYPPFLTNHQHIAEFTADQVRRMLDEAGLEARETGGVGLYPYWGIPGIDDVVRTVTDDDEEVVAMLRDLGKRAGDRFAYTGTVVARKPPS